MNKNLFNVAKIGITAGIALGGILFINKRSEKTKKEIERTVEEERLKKVFENKDIDLVENVAYTVD